VSLNNVLSCGAMPRIQVMPSTTLTAVVHSVLNSDEDGKLKMLTSMFKWGPWLSR